MSVLIHSSPLIPWHTQFSQKMYDGLKRIGISSGITSSRSKQSDISILLGTSLWRQIELDGEYLLIDRCSFGDTNNWVTLVWNGHGRRGNHCVPDNPSGRVTPDVLPWRTGGKVVICGQTETYSPHYAALTDWYSKVSATHFRKHPAGDNPTGLPLAAHWRDYGRVITLNSSVGVESVLHGIPTVTMDEAAMAWDVTGHKPDERVTPDRHDWLQWLSWTQWQHY